eukprot:2029201-Prymnesium_polylepis.1
MQTLEEEEEEAPQLAEHELEECFAELQQVLEEKDAASKTVSSLTALKPGDREYDDVLQELQSIKTCIENAIATIPQGADYIVRVVHQALTLMNTDPRYADQDIDDLGQDVLTLVEDALSFTNGSGRKEEDDEEDDDDEEEARASKRLKSQATAMTWTIEDHHVRMFISDNV